MAVYLTFIQLDKSFRQFFINNYSAFSKRITKSITIATIPSPPRLYRRVAGARYGSGESAYFSQKFSGSSRNKERLSVLSLPSNTEAISKFVSYQIAPDFHKGVIMNIYEFAMQMGKDGENYCHKLKDTSKWSFQVCMPSILVTSK